MTTQVLGGLAAIDAMFTRAKAQNRAAELKETKFRLRILRRCELLLKDQDPVINECGELIRIVAKLIRNAAST